MQNFVFAENGSLFLVMLCPLATCVVVDFRGRVCACSESVCMVFRHPAAKECPADRKRFEKGSPIFLVAKGISLKNGRASLSHQKKVDRFFN